jgi:hypothetical protein
MLRKMGIICNVHTSTFLNTMLYQKGKTNKKSVEVFINTLMTSKKKCGLKEPNTVFPFPNDFFFIHIFIECYIATSSKKTMQGAAYTQTVIGERYTLQPT